jgi:uncharacterized protein YheU (UPF0270 family)
VKIVENIIELFVVRNGTKARRNLSRERVKWKWK